MFQENLAEKCKSSSNSIRVSAFHPVTSLKRENSFQFTHGKAHLLKIFLWGLEFNLAADRMLLGGWLLCLSKEAILLFSLSLSL